jgi:hypothetical protein
MKPGMTLWKVDAANPKPFSPVHCKRLKNISSFDKSAYESSEVLGSLGDNVSAEFHDLKSEINALVE